MFRSLRLLILAAMQGLIFCEGAISEQQQDCENHSSRANQRFTTTNVNLRSYPSQNGEVLVTLPQGEEVYQFRIYGSWSQVNVASLNVTGFVANRFLSDQCIPGGGLSRKSLNRSQIVAILISNSLGSYSGNCPCPYNFDSAGRRCGRRSAYSRPGGRSPLCYASDVSNEQVERFRSNR